MKNNKINTTALAIAMSLVAGTALAQPNVTQTRDVSGFDVVKSLGSSDVEIKVGDAFKVEVSADERIISRILTEVNNGVLTISRERSERGNRGNFNRNAKVLITMPSIKAFKGRGSGDGYITDISAAQFNVELSGSGDLFLSGTCTNGEFKSRGSGDLEAKDFSCDNVEVRSQGSGDMDIGANLTVSLNLNGSGDVDIYGEARITSMRTRGSGDVSQIK